MGSLNAGHYLLSEEGRFFMGLTNEKTILPLYQDRHIFLLMIKLTYGLLDNLPYYST